MAAPYATHPGVSGGKKEDEFTLDELLDAMAERRQQESRSQQRDDDFSRAFKTLLATPAEYRRAQEEEYQRYADESAQINKAEAKRQEWDAMLQEQEQRRQADIDKLSGVDDYLLGSTYSEPEMDVLRDRAMNAAVLGANPMIAAAHENMFRLPPPSALSKLLKEGEIEKLETLDRMLDDDPKMPDEDLSYWKKMIGVSDRWLDPRDI